MMLPRTREAKLSTLLGPARIMMWFCLHFAPNAPFSGGFLGSSAVDLPAAEF
jgi:hypothetical protein